VQFALPYVDSFWLLVLLLAVLGVFDGVWLTFLVPISFDVAESPTLANHAAGNYPCGYSFNFEI
jgi:hypothetical protein